MKGWKTWLGAAIIGAGAALEAAGYKGAAETAALLGAAIAAVGIGHKIEKSNLNR